MAMERAPWTLKRLERAVEGFATQLQCAICLCAYDNPVSLPCNHCFCEECIHRALELKAVCPICKTPAKKRRLRYDTMIQELLRATDMLCAPADKLKQNKEREKQTDKAIQDQTVTTIKTESTPLAIKMVRTSEATANTSAAASTDELSSPSATESAEEVPATPDATTPVRRSSPRRPVARNLLSQTPAPPMSPALFEIKVPRAAKTQAVTTSPHRRSKSPIRIKQENQDHGDENIVTPRKRRRSSGIAIATVGQLEGVEQATQMAVNGAGGKVLTLANGSAAGPPNTGESQAQIPVEIAKFKVGDLIDMMERTWVGVNKPGGAARIMEAHGDDTYRVKFVIGSRTERRVPWFYISRPTQELLSDTTPSSSVKKRTRRRVSDIAVSPEMPAPKRRGRPPKSSPQSAGKTQTMIKAKNARRSTMVFLCSGFKEDRMKQIDEWADLLGAEVVSCWTNRVTHLIVKCGNGDEDDGEDGSAGNTDSSSSPREHKIGKRKLFSDSSLAKPGRWVLIRSLKYLKALVGGRWIVSDEWLEACAKRGGFIGEASFEADGHLKGKNIHDAVRRSRQAREKLLQLSLPDVVKSDIGTMLFADFFFHVIGEFLSPMPPSAELNSLICMGGGKLIPFIGDIPEVMNKGENHSRRLIIVSDKLNSRALQEQTKQLRALPQLQAVPSATIVNYLWVINSISEAKLRDLP